MKRSEALKRILIVWALTYYMDGSLKCFWDIYDVEEPKGTWSTKFIAANLVFFGTQYPDKDQLSTFIDKYTDWVIEITEHLEEIIIGVTTIEEVILEQVTKETWL